MTNIFMTLFYFFWYFIVLIAVITLHEFAHAWTARKLGDPTAYLAGRVTLNPKKHFDPLGFFMIVYSSISSIGFGWGKPVPINPYNLKNPNLHEFIIAIAGPFMNFLLGFIAFLMLKYMPVYIPLQKECLQIFFQVNIGLMAFNLLPIPPLDGSKIFGIIFPRTWNNYRSEFEQYGGILLMILILLLSPVLHFLLIPIITLIELFFGLF